MKKFFFTVLVCFNMLGLNAQIDSTQTLMNLLMQDEFFKARDYYRMYEKQVAAGGKLFYKYRMSYLSNNLDSASVYLDDFVTNYTKDARIDNKVVFFNLQVLLYTEMKDYSKLIETYDKIEQLIKKPPFDGEEYAEWQKEQFALMDEFKSDARKKITNPKMSVTRDNKGSKIMKLENDSLISSVIAMAKFNNIPLKTIFDTGASIPVIVSKECAEKCRFQEIPSPVDSFPLNGSMVRAHRALIDSIRVGSLIFTNVVGLVIHDNSISLLPDSTLLNEEQKKNYDSVVKSFDAIIGLPLLKSLGCIQLDWEKREMTLNLKSEVRKTKRDSNIFISKDELFMGLSINGRNYTGFVDLGNGTCIELSSNFYANNQNYIILSPLEQKRGVASLATINKNARYKTVINPRIMYGGKTLSLKKENDCIVDLDVSNLYGKDGQLGLLFFKRMAKKISLDFVNMRIDSFGGMKDG